MIVQRPITEHSRPVGMLVTIQATQPWFTTRHNVGHGAPDTDTQLRLVEPVELRCVGSCGASQHLNRPSECLAAQLCGQTNEPEPGSFWIRGGIRLNLHRFVDP